MARKTLSDFNYDYQAYANYLESAECANDDGYSTYGDQYGNVYTATNGDWTKGHGHVNENTGYYRDSNSPESNSKDHPWKNPWLKYNEKIVLSKEELEFIKEELIALKQNNQSKKIR